jgi:hypothetical protein
MQFPQPADIEDVWRVLRKSHDRDATLAFQRIARFIGTEPRGSESIARVTEDILTKAVDVPGSNDIRDCVVVVYDANSVELPPDWDSGWADPQKIKIKSNPQVVGVATERRRALLPLLRQSVIVKMQLAFNLLIGGTGTGWFAEIWARTCPLSWRIWRPERNKNEEEAPSHVLG